jgi:hypothetical protein
VQQEDWVQLVVVDREMDLIGQCDLDPDRPATLMLVHAEIDDLLHQADSDNAKY